MGRYVNPDNSSFQTSLNAKIYIDKSGLIEFTNSILSSTDAFICNSRPRRFGKSMTANMLAAYYSKGADSGALFSKLEISKDPSFKDHLNKYDVIHFDVQGFLSLAEKPEKVVPLIKKEIIAELRQYYPENVSKNEKSIANALAKINVATEKRFVVIIDEWDVLIRDDANNQKVQDDYIDFLRSLFKGTEPTKFIALAYMTGILPIKREKTQSALNNFKEYTMLYPGFLSEYVGFSESEVEDLCRKYSVDINDVGRWYDGYILKGSHVYNPMSVVNAVIDGDCRSYWSKTASFDAVVPYINMNYKGLREAIIEMLAGNEVRVNVDDFQNDTIRFSSKDDVITYLIHLGYFAYNERKKTAFIPNEEIRLEMKHAVEVNSWKEMNDFTKGSLEIVNATLAMDEKTVAEKLEKIHGDYVSAIEYNDENSLSCVLAIAYLASMDYYFSPKRELPAGNGFADFVYIPKPEYVPNKPALVIELKWNKDAKTAIDQIKERNYPESLKGYTDNILLVGVNYDKKTKKHECMIEKLS